MDAMIIAFFVIGLCLLVLKLLQLDKALSVLEGRIEDLEEQHREEPAD